MRNVLHGNMYNGYELSRTNKNDKGFRKDILKKIESIFQNMTTENTRVFFAMFVLKYPSDSALNYPNNNELLSNFIEALILHCKKQDYKPKYLWVRECSINGQVHYHLMLLLNENYIQNAHGLLHKATELWQGWLGIEDGRGLVHLCEPEENNINGYGGGVKIRRNDPNFQQVYAESFQRASYLAKCYSKGEAPPNINEFGSSRVPLAR